MLQLKCFKPDSGAATRVDRRMHERLEESLRYICHQAKDAIQIPEAELEGFYTRIHNGGRMPPWVFGYYYELAICLTEGKFEDAEGYLRAIATAEPVLHPPRVLNFSQEDLGGRSDIYTSLMVDPTGPDFIFTAPEESIALQFRERLADALGILDEHLPSLAQEIRALVSEILLVADGGTEGAVFDGGSAFTLWGAMMLNANSHSSPADLIEVLAHESAHLLLFGYCADEILIHGGTEAKYSSPLRRDLRPLDGIYHATFVSARMHYAVQELLKSNALSEKEREAVVPRLDANRQSFEQGLEVLNREADLTQHGRQILDVATEYMHSAGDLMSVAR